MSDEHKLIERLPSVEEYHRLRIAVGWETMDPEPTKKGLRNSLFSVCVIQNKKVIGYGRVVGDDAIFFYIQDIMVLPEFQRKGIGRCIMNAIIAYLNKHAYYDSFVGLMAAKGASKFYEKFGFVERPPEGPSMFRVWQKSHHADKAIQPIRIKSKS